LNGQVVRVLIADDSAMTRSMLSQLIGEQPDMEVIGTAVTGHEAVRRATELQPDVVLMDIHMPDLDGIQAAWLVSSKAPNGAVIMVTSEQRIDFLQKAMRAGAQGYILKPFGDGSQLLDTIREVSSRVRARQVIVGDGAPVAPLAPLRLGKRIAVLGTKGGVGRTLVATSLALILRRQTSQPVVLVDADFLFGDASIQLGLVPERSVLDLLPHMGALDSGLVDSVVTKHSSGLHLLARPPRPEQAEALTAEHVRSILSAFGQIYDWVVLDTQLSYDDRMLAVLDVADVFVLVVVAHLGALRNARHFLDAAKTLGYGQDRMCFVLNRANSTGGLSLDEIKSVLGTDQILKVPSVGAQLTESINDGQPLVEEQPRSPLARAMSAVTDHVRALASAEVAARRS
jgi:pilus assembly protein CpaE